MRIFLLALVLQVVCAGVSSAADLEISFDPAKPVMYLGGTTKVGGTTVYDHSEFAVKLTNRTSKTVDIHSVNFISIGDVERSGLGDIINYWPWEGPHTLLPQQSISFNKVWGFTVDTPNKKMTYRFEISYSLSGSSDVKMLTEDLVLAPEP